MMFFVKSALELCEMLESLHATVGLEMYSSKSKIMPSLNDMVLDCINVRGSDCVIHSIDSHYRYLDGWSRQQIIIAPQTCRIVYA